MSRTYGKASLEFGLHINAAGETVEASPDASSLKTKTSDLGWAHYGITELGGSITAVGDLSIPLIQNHCTGLEAR